MKVTEKSLKTRCTELNLGSLKDTAFGVRVELIGTAYTVSLVSSKFQPAALSGHMVLNH